MYVEYWRGQGIQGQKVHRQPNKQLNAVNK